MRPPGHEPTICGLIDNHANHYATESAASMEKTLSYIKQIVNRKQYIDCFRPFNITAF